MGVVSDAAAVVLAADGHGTLADDVWSDFQPDDPDLVTVCRDATGLPAWQPYAGLPAVLYHQVTVTCRAPSGQPDAAQARAVDAWRTLGVVADRTVTVAGVPVKVTFTASGAPTFLDDDGQDRPRYTVNFSAVMTGLL